MTINNKKIRQEAKIESEIIKMLSKQGYFVRALEGKRPQDAGVSDLMCVSSEGKISFLETKTPDEFDSPTGGLSDNQFNFLVKVQGKIVTLKSGELLFKGTDDVKKAIFDRMLKKGE